MLKTQVSLHGLILPALVLAAGSMLYGQEPIHLALHAEFDARMASVAEHLNGVMGYVIKDLSTGETFEHLPDAVFPTASSIKLTVLLELMRQSQEGKASLDEKHTVRRSEMTQGDDEPIITMLGDGTVTMSLGDLAIFMIELSDNTATNILIDRLGMDNINAGIIRLGLKETKIRRHMIDLEAARKGNENVSTPHEMVTLLEKVQAGQVLDPAHTKEYLDILRIPKRSLFHRALPDDVIIADKPGALEGVRCDSGFIDVPGHPFIMSVTTTYLAQDDEGERAVEEVARLAYDYFHRLSHASSYGRVVSHKP